MTSHRQYISIPSAVPGMGCLIILNIYYIWYPNDTKGSSQQNENLRVNICFDKYFCISWLVNTIYVCIYCTLSEFIFREVYTCYKRQRTQFRGKVERHDWISCFEISSTLPKTSNIQIQRWYILCTFGDIDIMDIKPLKGLGCYDLWIGLMSCILYALWQLFQLLRYTSPNTLVRYHLRTSILNFYTWTLRR